MTPVLLCVPVASEAASLHSEHGVSSFLSLTAEEISNRPVSNAFICKKYTVKHTCIHSWLPRCSFSLERQFIDVHFTSILLFRSPHLFSLQSLRNVAVGRPAHPCDTARRWTGDSCSRVSQPPSTFTGSTDHRVPTCRSPILKGQAMYAIVA